MDIGYWQRLDWLGLVIIYLITPFVPFAFPIRAAMTAYMATQHNWILVVLIANTIGTVSLVAQYFLYQWFGAARWLKKAEYFGWVERVSAMLDRRMFFSLVLLIASPVYETVLPLAAGAKRYSVWKFSAAMFLGRLAHIVPMALSGVGLKWLWSATR
jgi:uncharacterized membrane protein YdjX (TVP38/TMEM64 family)